MGTTVLYLPADGLQRMKTEAERAGPWECCGILVGHIDRLATGDRAITVDELYPTANVWSDQTAKPFEALLDPDGAAVPRTQRYTINPRQMLDIQKAARDRGATIVGVYHSHPNGTAEPSERDRQWAWSEYVYPIVAVRDGRAIDVRAWQLDDHRQFQPVALPIYS